MSHKQELRETIYSMAAQLNHEFSIEPFKHEQDQDVRQCYALIDMIETGAYNLGYRDGIHDDKSHVKMESGYSKEASYNRP